MPKVILPAPKSLTSPPLRVGVLVDSLKQPLWIHKVLKDINASPFATITVVVLHAKANATGRRPRVLSILRDGRHLLYWVYRRMDERLFKGQPDAFKVVGIEDLVDSCPILSLTATTRGGDDDLRDADIEKILEYDLDVALRFGFRSLTGSVLRIAKHGIWSYRHGDARATRGEPSDFWEMIEGSPVTASALEILEDDAEAGRIIYLSYAATHWLSMRAGRNSYYWKSAGFALRKLRDLYTNDAAALNSVTDASSHRPTPSRPYDAPTNAQMAKFLWRAGRRAITRRIRRSFVLDQWILSYRIHDDQPLRIDAGHEFKKMFPPKDRFWADPFPIKRNGRYYLFMEEYPYEKRKGFISVIEMDETGNWQPPTPVLVTERHLSYPFVFEWQGNYYMTPECAESDAVTLYRCRSFPFDWEPEAILLSNVRAVDPTLHQIEGRWWMFVNIAVEGARLTDELHLFYANRPQGPWTPHPRNPVKSDVRSARPAGRLFEYRGALYRPSQDSSLLPGYGMTLNIIDRISPEEYVEREVWKILPHWEKGVARIHTLNHVDGLTVIDCWYERWRYGAEMAASGLSSRS